MDTTINPMAVVAKHQKIPPVNLNAISTELGIRVFMSFLGINKQRKAIAGKIMRDSSARSGFSIWILTADPPNRQRFTHAHELAHFILHRDLIQNGLEDDAMYRSGLPEPYEIEANKLAADILMPISLVKEWRIQESDVGGLAKIFQVSTEAMRIRLEALDRLRN